MVIHGPKWCYMIRAYCCSALDTLNAYIQAEIFWGPEWGHEILGFGPNGAFRAFGTSMAPEWAKMTFNHVLCMWEVL